MTKLALLRWLRRVIGLGLLAVGPVMGDVRSPKAWAWGVCPRPKPMGRPHSGRQGRHAGVQVMAGEGGVSSEAGAAHGGRRGGDLHRGRVRLLLYPGDQVERLLVVIWTVVIGRYLGSL